MVDNDVAAERKRWMDRCLKSIGGGGGNGWNEPELKVLNARMRWIANDMKDTKPRQSVEAERAIWCAMFRDVSGFSDNVAGVELAIDMLYDIAEEMARG